MHRVCISSTGLYNPPEVITNAELVAAFNQFADLDNAAHAAEIAAGTRTAIPYSSVEFIEKASGIQRRYVVEKSGVLDPTRMRPRLRIRPDSEVSLMAEISIAASRDALARAGKQASDVDAVICAAANMQRAYPALAVEIQAALGIQGFAFDMNVACSSATFGIEMAVNAVKCGTARAVLVVNPEITSAFGLEGPRLPLHFWRCLHGHPGRAARHRARRCLRGAGHAVVHLVFQQHPQQRGLHVAQ